MPPEDHVPKVTPPPTVAGERARVRAIADPAKHKAEAEQVGKTFGRLATIADDLRRMEGIEAAMKEATPGASPKTRDGFALMRRMIDDTRELYRKAVPEPKDLTAPLE